MSLPVFVEPEHANMFARKTLTNGLYKIHQTICWSVGIRYPSLNENAMRYTVVA